MQVRNGRSECLDVLGNQGARINREPLGLAQTLWQNKTGYFSLLAGVTTVFAVGATDVLANAEKETKAPAGTSQQLAKVVADLNSACSKPELLRLQTSYALPHQKGRLNIVEQFAGGDTCPGVAIPGGTYTAGAPFTDTGTTVGANNTVNSVQAGCNDYTQAAGPDHIYSFQISARGAAPSITVTGSGGYDTSIYILNGTTGAMCPAGTANAVSNCLQGSDSTLANGTETITAGEINSLPLNTPLYLFIDSFYSSATAGNSGPYTVTIRDITVPGGGPAPDPSEAPVDMDNDGSTDYVVVRNTGGGPTGEVTWFTSLSDGGGPQPSQTWGIATDFFIPADFDGDGQSDIAVWRPGSPATFYILNSQTSTIRVEAFGESGDDPTVVGDYNDDNMDDLAVYREGANVGDQSTWHIKTSAGYYPVNWGLHGDFPAPGDYNGDGRADFVVQRPEGAESHFYKFLSTGEFSVEVFGTSTAAVVPGDYDGDGSTDIAVIDDNAGNMVWQFEPSGTAGSTVVSDTWGVTATDVPVPGDYNGDGSNDMAIWRPSTGTFWVMSFSDNTIFSQTWGTVNDYPVANYNVH